MFLIPAWLWRGGAFFRAACAGLAVGIFLGALVFAESGVLLGALVALFVTGIFYGIQTSRRMTKAWPAAMDLSPGERVAVSSAARRGRRIEEARLAPPTLEYVDALHNARAQARRWQRLMWFGAAAVLVLAVIDSFLATPRAVAVSWLLVVLCAVEIAWWPRAQDRLLGKADRAADSARDALRRQQVDDV